MNLGSRTVLVYADHFNKHPRARTHTGSRYYMKFSMLLQHISQLPGVNNTATDAQNHCSGELTGVF